MDGVGHCQVCDGITPPLTEQGTQHTLKQKHKTIITTYVGTFYKTLLDRELTVHSTHTYLPTYIQTYLGLPTWVRAHTSVLNRKGREIRFATIECLNGQSVSNPHRSTHTVHHMSLAR